MTNNDIIELWNGIKDSYYNKEYDKTLNLINEYIKNESIGITDFLLTIYVDSNIAFNNFEEALKVLKLIEKLYKDTYNKSKLVKKYINCFEFEEAKRVIETNKLEDEDYFYVANEFLLYGEYDLAKKYFNKCISITNECNLKEKCIKSISNINRHIEEGLFIQQSYAYFKKNGNNLEAGHVIYAKVFDEEYIKQDPVCNKRPYMIWKIIDDTLYCFPLTKRIRRDREEKNFYILYAQNYLNFDSDRDIKDNIVTIQKNNVEQVYEKINEADFNIVSKNIYFGMYYWDKDAISKKRNLLDMFVNDMNIERNDVITIVDRGSKNKRFYFVLEINLDPKQYKVVELIRNKEERCFSVLDGKEKYIKDKKLIYSTVKLDEEEKNLLLKEAEKNKTVKPGNIVSYNSRKLLILIEEDDIYICVDKTFNSDSSFIMVEYLSKNTKVDIIEKISKQELSIEMQNLNEYLRKNQKKEATRKKIILK